MKNLKYALLALSMLTLIGCGHTTMRGSVAMKISDTEAHVCMGNREVKLGDTVIAYINHCTTDVEGATDQAGIGLASICEKQKIGKGSVTKLLNEHYSVVKFDGIVPFEEGTIIERKRR